jgi:crotonobetainyl-CoA:carnitine CoA-transferase CaiB-like acyl-CoA transferase
MQAEAGFLSMTGEPDAPPTRFGLSMVDFMTGQMLATATLAGILDARATGVGRDYDVALLEAALHQLSYPATWYLNEGHVTGRAPRSAHPSVVPSQLFRTRDGWVFVMAQLPKFWEKLAVALEAPALLDDDRFRTPADRLRNRDVLTGILDGIFMTRPTADWVERLGGICPVAPVHDLAQALESAFIRGRGMVETVSHPDGRAIDVLANPILIDGKRVRASAAPKLGADTEALLAEVGVGDVAGLRARGVV